MEVVKQPYESTFANCLFASVLISGKNISSVGTDCLIEGKSNVIHSDMAEIKKTYTAHNSMNCYYITYNKAKEDVYFLGNVIMNEEKINNLKKLDQIAFLEDGWNGNSAKAFKKQLISKVREIITTLDIQPEMFPTACESVQLEYEKEDGSYLEVEINSDNMWEIFEINKYGEEKFFSITAHVASVIKAVNNFYG